MKLWGKTMAEIDDERLATIAEREALALRDQLYRERPSDLGRRYAAAQPQRAPISIGVLAVLGWVFIALLIGVAIVAAVLM